MDEANGPLAKKLQCVCHDTLPWLISFSLGVGVRARMSLFKTLRSIGKWIFLRSSRKKQETFHNSAKRDAERSQNRTVCCVRCHRELGLWPGSYLERTGSCVHCDHPQTPESTEAEEYASEAGWIPRMRRHKRKKKKPRSVKHPKQKRKRRSKTPITAFRGGYSNRGPGGGWHRTSSGWRKG